MANSNFSVLPKDFIAAQIGNLDEGSPPLPVGEYNVAIVSAKLERAKSDANNGYIALGVVILEGEFKRREGTIYINLFHQSDDAKEMAQKLLARILYCVGLAKTKIKDLSVLKDKVFKVKVVEDEKSEREGSTKLVGVSDKNGDKPFSSGFKRGEGAVEKPAETKPTTKKEPEPEPEEAEAEESADESGESSDDDGGEFPWNQ